MAFSQSEKIKAGLIWTSQILGMLDGLGSAEKQNAESIVNAMMQMILQEVYLANKVTGDKAWSEISKAIDRAIVMVNSGVASDSVTLLTEGLSRVTNIGQRSMSFLKEKGLLD